MKLTIKKKKTLFYYYFIEKIKPYQNSEIQFKRKKPYRYVIFIKNNNGEYYKIDNSENMFVIINTLNIMYKLLFK